MKLFTGIPQTFPLWLTLTFMNPLGSNPAAFPEDKHIMGCGLSEVHNIGQAVCYPALPMSGVPITPGAVHSLAEAE